MHEFFLRLVDALGGSVIGGVLAAVVLFVGVPGLALWAGWSQGRYCERINWRDPSRWH